MIAGVAIILAVSAVAAVTIGNRRVNLQANRRATASTTAAAAVNTAAAAASTAAAADIAVARASTAAVTSAVVNRVAIAIRSLPRKQGNENLFREINKRKLQLTHSLPFYLSSIFFTFMFVSTCKPPLSVSFQFILQYILHSNCFFRSFFLGRVKSKKAWFAELSTALLLFYCFNPVLII